MHIPVRPPARAASLLLGLLLVSAGCSGGDGGTPVSPPPPPPPPPPVPTVTVEVVRSVGVLGTPESTVRVDSGTVLSYSFSLAPGYQGLQVYVDSLAAPATGSVSTATGTHVLRAVALPVPVAPTTPEADAVQEIYASGGNPAQGFGALVAAVRSAVIQGDTATLGRVRRAEYAALVQGGPAAIERMRAGLAGTTFVLLGQTADEGAANNRVSASPARLSRAPQRSAVVIPPSRANDLFTPDTVVPTTIIYVNGILNLSAGSAESSASSILQALATVGFDAAGAVHRDAGSPRPASSIRVLYHFNPTIELQNPLKCLAALDWAGQTASLANGADDDGVWSTTVRTLLETAQRNGQAADCVFPWSSNGRVMDQYVQALLGQLGTLDASDLDLVNVIEDERTYGGGRNVIVLGHSQGTLIARTAIGSAGPLGADRGCLGGMAIASPVGTSVQWPNTQALYRVIALGKIGLISDILYPLGGVRSDGASSARTDRIENAMQSTWWWFTHAPTIEGLRLHFFGSYMADDGFRAPITQAILQQYRTLADVCGGTLSGSVYDLETLKPISGASVSAVVNDVVRGGTLVTGSSGGFRTARLSPILHDVVVTAPGYDTVRLAQRLVPFYSDAPVQEGPVYLAHPCPAGDSCSMQGDYTVHYVLSGVEGGLPTSCTFDSRMSLVQVDTAYSGTVTTSTYQQGCDMPDGGYVYWGAGTNYITGTIHGSTITMVHPAIPTWYPSGRAFLNGFQATEPAWHSGPFDLRVEIAATRVGAVTPAAADALRRALREGTTPATSAGPAVRGHP